MWTQGTRSWSEACYSHIDSTGRIGKRSAKLPRRSGCYQSKMLLAARPEPMQAHALTDALAISSLFGDAAPIQSRTCLQVSQGPLSLTCTQARATGGTIGFSLTARQRSPGARRPRRKVSSAQTAPGAARAPLGPADLPSPSLGQPARSGSGPDRLLPRPTRTSQA